MSLIKEINELNFLLKFVLLNICLTSPFFYIDIYFLTNETFNKAPLYIPIITAICMSICWYYSSTIVIALFHTSLQTKTEKQLQESHTTFTMISIVTISIISIFSIYFKLTFRNFFHICFVTIVLFLFLAIFLPSKKKETPK